jgi:hypothetical protein
VVAPRSGVPDDNTAAAFYERMQETWPAERPSRKRGKRTYRRQNERRVTVRADRLDQPDAAHLSRALLAAQRELARAEAEAAARRQRKPEDA